jgi:RNA polymerase sigma factor (sigma-70 family)
MPVRNLLRAEEAEQLLRQWKTRIESAVARRFRCHADRSDAAQLASMALIKAAEKYIASCGKPFENYGARAIANAAKDFAKARQRQRARFRTDLELPSIASRPFAGSERMMVTEFVGQLPGQLRTVYAAIYEMGCTQKETATLLGVTQPRVNRVHRRLLDQARVHLSQ